MRYIQPVGVFLDKKNNIGVTVFVSMFLKCLRLTEAEIDAEFVKKFMPDNYLSDKNPRQVAKDILAGCHERGESTESHETWLNEIDREYWSEIGRKSKNVDDFRDKIMQLNFILKEHFITKTAMCKEVESVMTTNKDGTQVLIPVSKYDLMECKVVGTNFQLSKESLVKFLPRFGYMKPKSRNLTCLY